MHVNVETKTALLKGYAHSGQMAKGEALFESMCSAKCTCSGGPVVLSHLQVLIALPYSIPLNDFSKGRPSKCANTEHTSKRLHVEQCICRQKRNCIWGCFYC